MFALVWGTREDGSVMADAMQGFIQGYRSAGGHYQSRGYVDLLGRERNRLAWIAHNVRRYNKEVAGPDPWLPAALLSSVQAPDLAELARLTALLDMP